MAERVTKLETKTECLPTLLSDVDGLKADRDRRRGQGDVLKLLAGAAAGSGILSLIADAIMLSRKP